MSASNNGLLYLKMSLKALISKPGLQTLSGVAGNYARWKRYSQPGKDPLNEQLPWITFPAIDFLKKIVTPAMTVFEYGSGGSTLFWASHVKHIVSVEHDVPWHGKVQEKLVARKISNVTYILAEAENDPDYARKNAANPADCISSDSHFRGKNFQKYVETIDRYPDQHFDVIVVDGRARPSCIAHAIPKLKKGGYLVVDNSDRTYYLAPFDFTGWKIKQFPGPVPYTPGFSKTSILQKN